MIVITMGIDLFRETRVLYNWELVYFLFLASCKTKSEDKPLWVCAIETLNSNLFSWFGWDLNSTFYGCQFHTNRYGLEMSYAVEKSVTN